MVSVVIVNWNGGKFLQKCLQALSLQTLTPTRIFVVDNGSTDHSSDWAEMIDGVAVKRLGRNYGFAAANNSVLDECNTKLVALLNPDAFPEPGWLEALVVASQLYPDVVAFGSRQMMYGADKKVDGLGDVYHLSGLVWRRGHGRELRIVDTNSHEIFSASAGAALYRREALVDVGGFDEDFFCYLEDVDLGFRLRLAGGRSMYVPDAVVQHVGSATTGGQHSDFSIYHGHRNLVWTYVKNMPGWIFWACLPLHLAMNILAIFWFISRGQGRVILRAKLDALVGLPWMWHKRKEIQRHRVASVAEIWRVLDKRVIAGRRGR